MTGSLEPLGPDSRRPGRLGADALRADLSDVAMFVRVFTRSFADALPESMVDVDYDRTMGDRLAGRPGTPVAVRLSFPERRLELRATRGWPEAEVQQVVRGVVHQPAAGRRSRSGCAPSPRSSPTSPRATPRRGRRWPHCSAAHDRGGVASCGASGRAVDRKL